MPKPWIWLRIASVVNGLFAVGHGLGHVRTIEGGLPGEAVLSARKTLHFNAMGSDRTYLASVCLAMAAFASRSAAS
jgi:hypothetical protein